MLSGGIAGCCFWGSMYPIDVIKARIQVNGVDVPPHVATI